MSFLASTGPVWIRDPSGTESRNMQLNKINRCSDSWLGRLPLATNWKMPVLHGPPAKVKVVHLLRCHTHTPLYKEAFTHRHSYSLYTRKLLRRRFFTGKLLQTKALYTQKLLLREACKQSSFTHRSFYTQKKNSLFTEQLLHTEAFACSHAQAFAQRNFAHARRNFAQTVLHTAAFTQKPINGPAFTFRRFCAQTPLHKEALT